jgi:hypothetical protein
VLLLDLIAERKIAEAVARGELDNLPGRGRPLDLGDDALVPAELRMAWRILKNAGFVPPEVEALRELGELERCVHDLQDGEARHAALRRLDCLRASLEARGRPGTFAAASPYLDRVLRRLARPPAASPAP